MNKKIYKYKNSLSGFTLIELLVVIFIIGVLVAVLLANILGARQRAEDTQRKSDLQQLKRALMMYYGDNQEYPDDLAVDLGGEYIKQLPETNYYWVSGDGEQFRATVLLDNLSDKDIASSKARCPRSSGSWGDAEYVVCED